MPLDIVRTPISTLCGALVLALAWAPSFVGAGTPGESPGWPEYLDLAHVYVSAEPDALAEQLAGVGEAAGISLERYLREHLEALRAFDGGADEAATRRRAVAYLLDYLAASRPESLTKSVESIRQLEDRLGRYENRYWFHYILAHEALERGERIHFAEQVLALWLRAIRPMEGSFEELEALALDSAPTSGFVAALPFLYENVARLILIRSDRLGKNRDLDPLLALVRLLDDGRIGAFPDLIPPESSSRAYLDMIIGRLDGLASDDGSLTFTLALLDADRRQIEASTLLADQGLSGETLRAIRRATGAYQRALSHAETAGGRAAVYGRALRQVAQLHAANRELADEVAVTSPFEIETAMEIYGELHDSIGGDWPAMGFRRAGEKAFHEAMRGLWHEIQETSLNAADHFLARAARGGPDASEQARSAARALTRLLELFEQYAAEGSPPALPDSAYFGAHEAARGIADAFLNFTRSPTEAEIDVAAQRYGQALDLFPFDRRMWPAMAAALQRHGRQGEYMERVRPIADRVLHSPEVDGWIRNGERDAQRIAAMRRGLGNAGVITYMGFGDALQIEELERQAAEIEERRSQLDLELEKLTRRRDEIVNRPYEPTPPAAASEEPDPRERPPASAPPELAEAAGRIADLKRRQSKLSAQARARSEALPLYRATFESDGLADELRADPQHPVHSLLRRYYHEQRRGHRP